MTARQYGLQAFPFDCALVRTADLIDRFGGSKEAVTAFLRSKGAKQLLRTTQGSGVPAITLWALRDHDRLMKKSARARVAIYLSHQDMAEPARDPLEL